MFCESLSILQTKCVILLYNLDDCGLSVAERKWKKDKQKISFIMMQDALYKYQRAVKSAKTIFFFRRCS